MLGSGGMARAYLEGFCAVRPIASCRVFSPTKKNRDTYAEEMSEALGIKVVAVDTPEEAVRGADIAATCTDTMSPTIKAEWLAPGVHVTDLCEEEIDDECLARMDVKIRQGEGGLPLPEKGRVMRLVGHSPVAYVAGTEQQLKRLPPKPRPNLRSRKAGRTIVIFITAVPKAAKATSRSPSIIISEIRVWHSPRSAATC